MAIRLRHVDGYLVALCAAATQAEPGDVYLDDGQHYALARKFDRDWTWNGLMKPRPPGCPAAPEEAIMERVEGSLDEHAADQQRLAEAVAERDQQAGRVAELEAKLRDAGDWRAHI